MAEVAFSLTTKALSKPTGGAANGNVPEAVDPANVDTFANGGVEVLVVDNTGASSRTITFKDKNGTDLTAVTIAANELQVIGPFDVGIFGNTVKLVGSNAALEVVPVTLTGGGLTNVLTTR